MTDTKKVLIFKGGWDGHEPDLIAERFAGIMEKNGYSCVIYDNQEVMLDLELVMSQEQGSQAATAVCVMHSAMMWNGNL